MINFFKKYYFLIIPLIVTAYMLVQGIPLTVNDDRFIMEMAKSFQTNAHSEYLMFVSIIQGYILKFLYNLVPSVNWFAVLYLFTINITFALFYKIIQNYNNKLIFVGITTLTQIAAMSLITFTMMPFICSTAAVLWGLEYIKEINKSSIKHFILVFFMFFLGFSIRSSSPFVCIFLVFLPVYFFAVKERRNSIWVVALLLSFCTIANYTNIWAKDAYKKTFSYEMYYNQFHEYRSMVSDTTAIDYEENKDGCYDLIYYTNEDAYANWDDIGGSRTRFIMKDGKIILDKQWYEDYDY